MAMADAAGRWTMDDGRWTMDDGRWTDGRWTMDDGRTVLYPRIVRVVGIDLGERRIGLAISDGTATLARPLKTIERGQSDAHVVTALREILAELGGDDPVGCIVIGLPTRLDGSDNLQTPRVKKIVALLKDQVDIPVVTQDERLSSREAEERLSLREKDWRKRKAKLDAAAAAVILQDYLDARTRRAPGVDRQKEIE
jgi:putative Holliday junction resolvase